VVVRHGMVAVAVAQAAVAWLVVGLTWWTTARLALAFPLAELGRMAAGVCAAAALCTATAAAVGPLVGPADSVPAALAESAVLLAVYTGAVLLTQRRALRELRSLGADR
jgi:hypothetical protein